MNSRERVIRTLEFNNPDKIPVDLWMLPAARIKHGEKIDEVCSKYERDIVSLCGPFDHAFTPEYYQLGTYVDPWGSTWTNIQEGVIGEVKNPVFDSYDKIEGYCAPIERFISEWNENKDTIKENILKARKDGKFIIGGWLSLFERLQYLRGTEDLYCDIAMEEPKLFEMIEIMMKFMRCYVDCWLELDIDAMAFGDDWGSQISTLIAPQTWRKIFKPLYQELINKIKSVGKKVFFHSDGYIFELYPDFIEMGVDAINSQLWCMGVEKVAKKFAGKITFWGEISRQNTLPNGTPDDVRNSAEIMKKNLFVNGGGLIGQSEVNGDVPIENVDALLSAWNN